MLSDEEKKAIEELKACRTFWEERLNKPNLSEDDTKEAYEEIEQDNIILNLIEKLQRKEGLKMEEYYVIVDLENLEYMKNGCPAKIIYADKFKTYEEAKKELDDYDKDFNGAIYKVKEVIERNIKLISTRNGDIEAV